MSKILVTGATGHLGGSVIETLLKKISPSGISILTRNEEKRKDFESKGFNAFLGSYENVISLENAMNDVETVLLISSGDQGDRMLEHRNVIDMASKKGVKHIAYTSRCLNNPDTLVNKLMKEHFQTEDYIIKSGLKYTFFRNILYMDVVPQFIGGNSALLNGIFLPAGDGKVSFALRSEMGEAMGNVLLNTMVGNRIYNFTGSETYTFHDVAAVLTELTGKEVKYTNVENELYHAQMKQRNLPESVILKIADFITDVRNNQEADIYDDLKNELGRKPTNLKEGLKRLFGL
ncbi:MAG: SDR family oxidoreductase [Opitutaceae bacterium]|nr:SDR family oxidoreductase [Cytophagales bacterium]